MTHDELKALRVLYDKANRGPIILDRYEMMVMPKNVYEHHRDIREALPKLIEEVERLNKLNDKLSTDLVNREAVLGATKDERDKVIQNGLNLLTNLYALEKERNSLKAEVEKLKELLEASEMFREAYRKGKLKLYSMQGAIAEAAMSHLPCSEGPLERAAAQAVGKRMGWIEQEYGYELVKERDALKAEVKKLTHISERHRDNAADRLAESQALVKERDQLKAEVAENKKTIKAMDLIRQQQNREIADLRKERDAALARVGKLMEIAQCDLEYCYTPAMTFPGVMHSSNCRKCTIAADDKDIDHKPVPPEFEKTFKKEFWNILAGDEKETDNG